MHIALVNQWYPPETGGGGVATHNEFFARACVGLGHQVTVIAKALDARARKVETRDGVTIYRVPSPDLYRYRRLPIIGRQYRAIQAAAYSRRVCNALRALHSLSPVDIVEFAEINAEGLFRRAGIGKRMVVRCHTPTFILKDYYVADEMPFAPGLLSWFEKRVIARADAITAPSGDMARQIEETCGLAGGTVRVIPNALDTSLFSPPEARATSQTVNILFVGRLERAKGIETLAAAIPAVCDAAGNVRFTIIGGSRPRAGGGSTLDYMRDTLDRYIRDGRVELRGFVPDGDLLAAYREADVCVVPSLLYESFSLTCAQAMACGLPVVASRIGGIPETLGEAGIIIPPGNADDLAQALIRLADDAAQRAVLGEAARQSAVSRFSAGVVASQIVEVYTRMLQDR